MTLQDLRDNRAEIIKTITELVGENNIAAVMANMVKGIDCCDSIDELIEGSISIIDFNLTAKKDSASVQAYNNYLINEDVHFNQISKSFLKN